MCFYVRSTVAFVYVSYEQTDVMHNELTAVEMSCNLINFEVCVRVI
jgi:virulence-associated protein VapD